MDSVSSVSTEELSPEKATELYTRHQRLRAWLRWLLPLGVLPVAGLVLLALTYPTRTPLAGYRYQQVGVQAGKTKTWWILAHRGDQAELLLRADTSRSWQRHTLNIDSSQAHALALDWGGRALLVGLGTVRIYDAQLRRVGPVHYLDSGRFQGRWVAADATGKWAFIVGDHNRAQQTSDGGKTWAASTILTSTPKPEQVVRRVLVDNEDKAVYWASQQGSLPVEYEKPQSPQNGPAAVLRFTPWRRPLSAPLAWVGFDEQDDLVALDQRGTWGSPDKVDSTSSQQISALAGVAFLPGAAATSLGISATQVVQGQLSKQLVALTGLPDAISGSSTTSIKANPAPGAASLPKKTTPTKQTPRSLVKTSAAPDAITPAKQPDNTSTRKSARKTVRKTLKIPPPPTDPYAQGAPDTKGSDNAPVNEQKPTQNPVQQTPGGKPLPANSPVQQAPQNQAAPSKEPEKSTPKTTD